ncbi:MAG: MBOAT family protein [Lachnospiraceae bacterium]|nr:MBOAT family protein [Lachnospiraceae bacterium]
MVFSSVIFLTAFLPLTFILYYLPFSIKYKNAVLIIMSLLFYSFGEPVYIFLMLGSVIMNYLFGRLLGKTEGKRKLWLILSVVFNIGLLGVFKYTGFFIESVNQAFSLTLHVPKIELPIGISFYTFQAMSYVIDVYRDEKQVQNNFFKLLLYIAFFPQLIAGPIVRYHDIDMQLGKRGVDGKGKASLSMIMAGMERFTKGLAKKVIIANAMGQIADTIYALDITGYNALAAWAGAITYVFQIYYDFSGYSDMAIGLAKMFGFDFLENFDHPYSSLSIKEFWRRWHISLSTWFKEYVYIPLGGNRRGRVRTNVNKIIVFFLTGFWHGANWTFIVWGLFHGAFLIIEDAVNVGLKKRRESRFNNKELSEDSKELSEDGKIENNIKKVNDINDIKEGLVNNNIAVKILKNIYVWIVVTVGFVFFRADNISIALSFIGKMFAGFSKNRASVVLVCRLFNPYNLFVIILAFILSYPVMKFCKDKLSDKKIYKSMAAIGSLLLLFMCILNLASEAYNPFIYFRF